MLAELAEDAAKGEIAGIYGEIRRLWAVPYVSSLQRHLATRPGWLGRICIFSTHQARPEPFGPSVTRM